MARILRCLFDWQLCFTYINCLLASLAYHELGVWGEVLFQTPFHTTICLHSTDSFLSTMALTSLLDFMFFYPPPRLWLPAYLCCRLNFLIDILTFPLLLIYLHCLLVSKSCFFKITMLFYLWKRITVFHSMFFMLLPWPSTIPVNHAKYCYAQSAVVFSPLCLSGGILFLISWSRAYFFRINFLAPK